VIVGAVFAALAAQSWRRWTDPLIDFGAELYVPWRLLEGDRLYAEIAYRNGPLSPFVNALWFQLFGVSVTTLVFCNLALLALLCLLTWRLFAATGRLAQTLVCVALLVAFGFANFTETANYNWVTPYQHSQTHGVLLGFAMIAALGAALRSGSRRAWTAAGICLGLAFLTKAELFVPAAAAAATATALAFAQPHSARPARGLAVFAAAALVPPLVAFALLVFAARLPAEMAFDGVLGNWRYLGADLLADRFYRKGSGLDDPAGNAFAAVRSFASVMLAFGAVLLADRALLRSPRRRGLGFAFGAALVALLALAGPVVPWFDAARALPATSALGAGALAFAWLRTREDVARRAQLAPLLLLAVYALRCSGRCCSRRASGTTASRSQCPPRCCSQPAPWRERRGSRGAATAAARWRASSASRWSSQRCSACGASRADSTRAGASSSAPGAMRSWSTPKRARRSPKLSNISMNWQRRRRRCSCFPRVCR